MIKSRRIIVYGAKKLMYGENYCFVVVNVSVF